MYEPLVRKIAVLMKDYYVLRTINDAFVFAGAKESWLNDIAGDSEQTYGSTRQVRVEQWIAGIEQNAPNSLEPILRSVVEQLLDNADVPSSDKAYLSRQVNTLKPSATIDSLVLRALVNHASEALFDIEQYISRISKSIDDDPESAIGSTKELLESVFKAILEQCGERTGTDDFPALLKRVQKLLSLDPAVVHATKGREITKRVLSSIGQIVIGVDELRNLYGTGHGKVRRTGVSPRHARLVVGAGSTLALFLIETFKAKQLLSDE